MRYENIQQGYFVRRVNRFIAHIEIEGKEEIVHVKNTGRCAELFVPGAVVYVQKSDQPNRKTKWDLIAVEKQTESGMRMVNVDSQVTNRVVKEWLEDGQLFSHMVQIQTEYTYGKSRFDLYVEADSKKILIEVKGVTLEEEGRVRFPDAPSDRAVKHVEELMKAALDGYEAYVLFVIQMKDVRYFMPNVDTHPAFAEALWRASQEGVHVLSYDCEVTADSIRICQEVPVRLRDALK